MKKLFISYTPADQDIFDELMQQLSPLQKQGFISIENDQNIMAGTDLQTAIKEQLQQADIILIVLSADLLSSDLAMNEEIPLAMQQHETGKSKVIPLIARACLWEDTALVSCSPLPDNKVPITSKKHWDSPDEPYLQIAKKIKTWIEKTRNPEEEKAIILALKEAFDRVAHDTDFALFFKHKDAHYFLPEYHNRLGWHYHVGKGCIEDFELAIKHYELAAKQGYSVAHFNLGQMYEYGKGVQVDYEKAYNHYKIAAERGHISAHNSLGIMYFYGKFVPKDYELAKEWYQKAANQGNQYAQSNLGYYYENGLNGTPDIKEALKWYKLSAAQGNEYAKQRIAALEQ